VITETKSDPAQQAPTQNANLNPVPTPTPAPVAPIDDYSQNGKIKLQVTAKEDTWLRITVDGKVTVERVLARGESSLAAANGSAKILLGNAGGVDIRFNGADIGMVGPRGQVRTVDFTPDKHTVIEPPKKPAPASDAQTAPQPVAESN
jgi:hypothetical protein